MVQIKLRLEWIKGEHERDSCDLQILFLKNKKKKKISGTVLRVKKTD
jgi:hypothetical protein